MASRLIDTLSYTHLEEALANKELANVVRKILVDSGKFTAREIVVLAARFGLHDRGSGDGMFEIADMLNCTGERVRQIELKALRKLRHPRFAKRLKEFL